MTFDDTVDAIKTIMGDDAEVTADIACEHALNALDLLVLLAADRRTAPQVIANRVFIGQILTRAQLVASFLEIVR